jgi:hypothetical protein
MKAIVSRMGSGRELHDLVEERVSTYKVACGQIPVKHRVRLVEEDQVPTNEAIAECPRCAKIRQGASA